MATEIDLCKLDKDDLNKYMMLNSLIYNIIWMDNYEATEVGQQPNWFAKMKQK